MIESESVSLFIISIVHFIALILLVFFSVYIYLKVNKGGLLYSFLGVQASFFMWIFFKILKTVAPVVELRWLFVVIQYFGICTLELTFLQFAYYYSRGKSLPKKILLLGTCVAFVQFLVVLTNESHHLFYSTFNFRGNSFGPLFYAFMGIMYSCVIIGILLVGQRFRKDFYKKFAFYELSIAMIIPLVTNFFYLSGHYHKLMKYLGWYPFDITPLGFELSLSIFAFAIYKRDFLSIMPIYLDEIINQVPTGVVIFDKKGQMIEYNQLAQQYLDEGLPLREIELIEDNSSYIVFFLGKYMEVFYKSIIDTKKRNMGTLVTIVDISSYIFLKSNLVEQIEELEEVTKELEMSIQLNDDLTLVSSKNYVARELHDILGHSMTITIKLLEVALIECNELKCSNDDAYREKKDILLEKLKEAFDICSKGYNDLRISLVEKQQISFDIVNLKSEISKMSNVLKFAGIEFNMTLSHINIFFSEEEYTIIKRFCQECITNSIKHGKASYIHIDMDFQQKPYKICIHDNGVGCTSMIKGNGLKGIEDRVKSIDGKLHWASSPLNGFDMTLSYE